MSPFGVFGKKDWDVDTRVIATRLQKLEGYVQHLRTLQQAPLDEYIEDENLQAIVERRLQLSIQVCIDIASYLIAQLGLQAPDEQHNVFVVLGREHIISPDLANRMIGMVRFRNILVHDYLDIDSKLVYQHLSERIKDFEQFAQEISTSLF